MFKTLTERPPINKINDFVWEIPQSYKEGMQVPARIYASKKLLDEMDFGVFDQVTNVACLPGIQKYAYCMADGHQGYGFPIGGVAAFDAETGVISPGGVGFDINCGMRLVTTNLTFKDIQPKIKELVDHLFKTVPSGVGSKGFVNVNKNQFKNLMQDGVKWAVDNGYGWNQDIGRCEAQGKIEWADPSKVSEKSISRGLNQLGTLGSGNHYLEIQVAHPNNIFDNNNAKKLGIKEAEQVVIMFHCGSRGFGHQIATEYLRLFLDNMKKYNIKILDNELSCAPFTSKEGQDYYKAMACAANMAFANRQVILHRIREGFSKIFNDTPENLGLESIWDNCHNIARREKYKIDGKFKWVITHRKGATKSFGPNHEELPNEYKDIGSPIILGGSMQTGSYLLVGTTKAEEETFSSTAHGSGRTMSRTKAKSQFRGEKLQKEMLDKGIYVRAMSMSGLAEEAGLAYKNISEVVDSIHKTGISKKVVGLVPIANVKG